MTVGLSFPPKPIKALCSSISFNMPLVRDACVASCKLNRSSPEIERILLNESKRNDGLTPKALISANESRSEFMSTFDSGFCSFSCERSFWSSEGKEIFFSISLISTSERLLDLDLDRCLSE